MKIGRYKKEDGFLSAMVLIFLVTLSLMGLGAYVLIRTEVVTIGSQINRVKADYAAEGAMYYAIKRVQSATLPLSETISIGDGGVTIYAARDSGTGNVTVTVRSTVSGIKSNLQVVMNSISLESLGLWTTGSCSDITVRDEGGQEDESLKIEQADSIPQMDISALYSTASSQGHVYSGTYKPLNDYPNGSFYHSPGVPNVTYVNGDLEISAGRRVYGIFVVTGEVRIKSSFFGGAGRIEGVVYLPNDQDLEMDSYTRINGGVLSNGDVSGGLFSDGIIQYNSDRMEAFSNFRMYPDAGGSVQISSWQYIGSDQ